MDKFGTISEKVRIRFRKTGDLRLVSHHDLMRCFERMLRRAGLPLRSSQGFNPRPRLIFALSLPLGIAGCDEVVELELLAELPVEEIHDRLVRQAPAGLEIRSVQQIAPRSGAQVQSACYRLPLPPSHPAGLPDRAAAILARPDCWVERARPQPRRLDIRPYLLDIRVLPEAVEIDLLVTPHGIARPDEVLQMLGLRDLLDAGSVLERVGLTLHDEHTDPSFPRSSVGTHAAAVPTANRGNEENILPVADLDTLEACPSGPEEYTQSVSEEGKL